MNKVPFEFFNPEDEKHIEVLDSLTDLFFDQHSPSKWAGREMELLDRILGPVDDEYIEGSFTRNGLDPGNARRNNMSFWFAALGDEFHSILNLVDFDKLEFFFNMQRYVSVYPHKLIRFYVAYKALATPPPILDALYAFAVIVHTQYRKKFYGWQNDGQ